VAHLRVNLTGAETVVASGRCQSGDYWGPPVSSPPISAAVTVPGVAGAGQICPMSGNARGLPATDIAQTDDLSGGQTITEVPQFEGFSPSPDETLYGPFVALAQVGLPGPNGSIFGATGATVALTITRAASRRRVFFSANVNRSAGVAVGALPPGVYDATWMLRDLAGDTRTVHSRFVEEK